VREVSAEVYPQVVHEASQTNPPRRVKMRVQRGVGRARRLAAAMFAQGQHRMSPREAACVQRFRSRPQRVRQTAYRCAATAAACVGCKRRACCACGACVKMRAAKCARACAPARAERAVGRSCGGVAQCKRQRGASKRLIGGGASYRRAGVQWRAWHLAVAGRGAWRYGAAGGSNVMQAKYCRECPSAPPGR